jgi:hypothetical protein
MEKGDGVIYKFLQKIFASNKKGTQCTVKLNTQWNWLCSLAAIPSASGDELEGGPIERMKLKLKLSHRGNLAVKWRQAVSSDRVCRLGCDVVGQPWKSARSSW